jgi:hypothetical protein
MVLKPADSGLTVQFVYRALLKRPSFQRALKELLEKGFIAESTRPSMFWFNPNLFFNGDRMTFIHEYRRKPVMPDRDPNTVDWLGEENL